MPHEWVNYKSLRAELSFIEILRHYGVELKLIFYTALKIVLYYHSVTAVRDERGTTDAEIGDQ